LREIFEKNEHNLLAPYAAKSADSKGREFSEPPSASRTCFQRDRDRIIHSKAFRRLKDKTQVFIATDHDHYRSRLTHTLEVAQISRHIARVLRLNEDLAEAIALSHDLGHPPFGHSGEKELNRLMKDHGGFEHNTQSLRVITKLENKYPRFPGLNLSFEIKEGLKKHETPWDHPDLNTNEPHAYLTLEAQVVNLADEIAYNNHDLDDGLNAGLINESELSHHIQLWKNAKEKIKQNYSELNDSEMQHLINSELISTQLQDVIDTTTQNIKTHNIQSISDIQRLTTPLVSFSQPMKAKNQKLRRYLFTQFYSHTTIYRMNIKGQLIIRNLFEAFNTDPKLLPDHHQAKISKNSPKERVVTDYIAGMTDGFALREYHTIFS